MSSYIIKRLLAMIPVLGIILILSFVLFQYSGADPVKSLLSIRGISDDDKIRLDYEKEYTLIAKELSRDLPLFYISVVPSYYPDTLFHIVLPEKRNHAKKLLARHKNWNHVSQYLERLSVLTSLEHDADMLPSLKQAIYQYNQGVQTEDIVRIRQSIRADIARSDRRIQDGFESFFESQHLLVSNQGTFYYPRICFHGTDCQFHQWFKRIIVGDFGLAMTDGRPVMAKLSKSLGWSVILALLSIFFACILSVLIGVLTALKKGSLLDSSIYLILFSIFSTPLFWFATLMIVFFTTKDFGSLTDIFPSVGLFYTGDGNIVQKLSHNVKLLILPVFCLSIHSTAYLGRQIRASLLQQSGIPYNLTAIGKGMSQKSALVKHVLPNALLPFITIVIGAIPASLAGALVIEVLFNIPGMGRLMFQSILNDDWNTISAILIVISLATMIFYLVGDIVYAYVNPKIKLAE